MISKAEQIQLRAMALKVQKQREIKGSLLKFMLKDGQGNWKNAKHLDLLVKKLEKFVEDVREGRSPRLIICLPPRAGKSELTTKKFPAWVLGNNPDWEMIIASYSSDLAEEFSRICRNTFRTHQETFGEKLAADSNSVKEWGIEGKRGKLVATGVGGAATGKGAHIAIIDDPIKNREEAQSGLKRQRVIDWYKSTIRTRLAPGGGLIVIQTRWHDQDLAGYLMDEMATGEGESFETIILPALAEENDVLGRKVGEALWPERFPLSELEKIRKAIGRLEWDSLYQQKPSIEGGGMFKSEQFKYFKLIDNEIIREDGSRIALDDCRIFQIADTALKTAKQNDDTGIGTFALDKKHNLYLLDMMLDKIEVPDQYGEIKRRHSQWGAQFSAIEDKQSGTGIIQEAQRESFPLRALKANGDKTTRAFNISVKFEHGKVYFNKAIKCLTKLEEQLKKFPNAAHDDGVDVMSYAGIVTGELTSLFGYIGKKVVSV